ncbi:hypothetical protein Tco_0071680 [Tanacetum coccineum]
MSCKHVVASIWNMAVMAWKLTYQSLRPRKKRIKTRAKLMDNMAKGGYNQTAAFSKSIIRVNTSELEHSHVHHISIHLKLLKNSFQEPSHGTSQVKMTKQTVRRYSLVKTTKSSAKRALHLNGSVVKDNKLWN